MDKILRCDAAIVGAGPAGSGLAASLARRGWDVLLLERDRLPRHKVCGEFLSPEAQTSLHELGLHQAVAELKPVELTNAQLVSASGRAVGVPLPGAAWGVSRYMLDAALALGATAQGAHLWQDSTVTGCDVAESGEGWILQARGSDGPVRVHARAAFAACGRHSLAALPPHAPARGGRFSSKQRVRYVGVKCHYENLPMPDRVELYFFDGGYAGINRVAGERVNLCLLASYEAFAAAGGSVTALIEAAARWNPLLATRLQGARALPATECTVAPVDTHRPARPWDGVPCLGDTATMIPPFCGDGMAMALRSAELCAPLAHAYLQGELSMEEWSSAYCAAWHREFDGRLRAGRLLQRVLERPALADGLLCAGQWVPPLANYFVRATRGHGSAVVAAAGTPMA